ncbi:nitrate reductase [Peribacillus saganii]|uniref:Nitrate reductase n=1 Tax=Peribacillus saganii TaxID=2303992 RepID=A0A372LQK8_9BACI|nr:NCS1 family transporter [Peribacillus saganii]RFU70509.1 nitrate reductase [Peribacillus saganii]
MDFQKQNIVKNHLLEESILPIANKNKTIGNIGYIAIWVGMTVMLVLYQFGAQAIASHHIVPSLLAIFLGFFIMGALMLLSADVGTEHGLTNAVYMRAPFGIYGTHFPAVSKGVVAAIWFGIQTYLGSLALNGIFEYLTGFDNWIIWYILFGIVQIINTALGIKAVERFADFAAPVLILISIWMYFFLNDIATLNGINIWTFVGNENTPLFLIFLTNFSLWTPLCLDLPNITRYLKVDTNTMSFSKRNRNLYIAQLVALPLVAVLLTFIGAIAFAATGDWNPINIIQDNQTGFVLVVLLALVLFAQWSTNTAANVIPAALAFVNAGAPFISYKAGVVIAGLVGTLTMPWLILDNIMVFLGYYGGALSAVAGIVICDYYVIRKRRLNVPELYKVNGQYTYSKGFNWAGMVSWIIAGGLAIWQLEYAYIVGFPAGFVLYLVLMKTWILPRYPQAEIDSGFDAEYLATSVGKDWVYTSEGFVRLDCNQPKISSQKPKEEIV